MPSYDLSEFLDDGAVELTGIRSEKHPDGKSYRFSSPTAKIGLYLTHLFDIGAQARAGVTADVDPAKLTLDDSEEHDLYRQVMGATFDELIADGVPWSSVQQVFRLLFRKHAAGQDIGVMLGEGAGREATTKPTRQRKAGSRSNRASTAIPAPTLDLGSTPSSSSTHGEPAAAAG